MATQLFLVLVAAVLVQTHAIPTASAVEPRDAVEAKPSQGMGGKTGTLPNERIDVAGKSREYRLVVPREIDPQKPALLVFAFHGLLDSKNLMPLYSQLDKLAEKERFILVYPNGINRHWPLVLERAKDDFAFFDALYDHLTSQYNIDLNRVNLVGMSNGAYFSHLLASQRSEKIAAIAVHSGGLGVLEKRAPDVKRKYAVLVIHGDADPLVPVDEGRKTRDAYRKWGHEVEYLEVPDLRHFWAHKAGINEQIGKFFAAHPLKLEFKL